MSNQQTKITQRTITNIKATGSVYFIRDLQLTGFAIKVTATGKASYIAETRIKSAAGIRIDIGSVDTERLEEAKAECRSIIALAKRGIDPRHTREARNPINKSLEQHIKQYFERLDEVDGHELRSLIIIHDLGLAEPVDSFVQRLQAGCGS